MAVLMLEIFARASTDTTPDSLPEHDWLAALFRHELASLSREPTGVLPLLGYEVTPYEDAARIEVQCVTGSGTEAMEIVAARLEAAMREHPDTFDGWHLYAGATQVQMSDN